MWKKKQQTQNALFVLNLHQIKIRYLIYSFNLPQE